MSKSSYIPMTFELELDDIPVRVELEFYPGDPGKTYGPPEDCWEPVSADVEIQSVINLLTNEKITDPTREQADRWTDIIFEKAMDLWEESSISCWDNTVAS